MVETGAEVREMQGRVWGELHREPVRCKENSTESLNCSRGWWGKIHSAIREVIITERGPVEMELWKLLAMMAIAMMSAPGGVHASCSPGTNGVW